MRTTATTLNHSSPVYLVEDDAGSRQAMRMALESVNIRTHCHGRAETLLEEVGAELAGCLIVDLRLPDMSALQLLQRLRERLGHYPVSILVTGFGDVTTAVAAMRMGAIDVMEKPLRPQSLIEGAQAALELDGLQRRRRKEQAGINRASAQLSPRERQLLPLLLEGKGNKQIAAELHLSDKTVHSHRSHILSKMGVSSVVELIRRYHLLDSSSLSESLPCIYPMQ